MTKTVTRLQTALEYFRAIPPQRRLIQAHGWHHICSIEVVMQRVLLASSGALFLGSAGAFFLLVPLLSIMTVALMMAGLMLMFGLGFQAGAQGIRPSETSGKLRGPWSTPMLPSGADGPRHELGSQRALGS